MHGAHRREAGPRLRAPRAAAMVMTGAALLGVVSGCATFNAALGKQEAVVTFRTGTTNATRLKIRVACSHIPNAKPEPLPTDHLASDILQDVIYRVDNASNAQIAELDGCLQKYPAVLGIYIQTPGDS